MRYLTFSKFSEFKNKVRDRLRGEVIVGGLRSLREGGKGRWYYNDLDNHIESMTKKFGSDDWYTVQDIDGKSRHIKDGFGNIIRIPKDIRKDAQERGINRLAITGKGVDSWPRDYYWKNERYGIK